MNYTAYLLSPEWKAIRQVKLKQAYHKRWRDGTVNNKPPLAIHPTMCQCWYDYRTNETTMETKSVNAFTPDEVAKLPKWAQEKIKDLSRERDISVHELNSYLDSQTPSPIMVEEHPCIGESRGPSFKTRYIQASDVKFVWAGVELTVSLRDGSHQHDNAIKLQWSDMDRSMSHVAMMPLSYNQVQLISKQNMR